MDTIAKRIMAVVEATGGNKSEFARTIGVTPAYISKLGKEPDRIPSERTIKDICEKYSVSAKWLRTGEGKMFIDLNREAQITKIVSEALRGENPTDQQRFLNALLGATPEELRAIAEFAKRLAAEYEKEKRDS